MCHFKVSDNTDHPTIPAKHDHLLLSAAFDILALELGGDIKKTQETKKVGC